MKLTLYNFSIKSGYQGTINIDTDKDKIAEGGEGVVYGISSGKLVKIYKWGGKGRAEKESKLNKLTYMVENPPDNVDSLAWPESMVFTKMTANGDSFAGFSMKNFRNFHGIGNVYDTDERNIIFSSFTWNFLFITARNVSFVVEHLHKSNYILGDINEGNILVNDHAQVAFIDCDSYKIVGKNFGETTVGVDEYTPKERLAMNLYGVENIVQERFSLSILLFKILMLGAHPFNVVYTGTGEKPARNENIIACRSIFSGKKAPVSTPPLSAIPEDLLNLFKQALGAGCDSPAKRPSSKEWYGAFETTLKMKQHQCNINKNHVYFGNRISNQCPWCQYKRQTGIDPFPETEKSESEVLTWTETPVTFVMAGISGGPWILKVDDKRYSCDDNTITIKLEPGIHTFSGSSLNGTFYSSKSQIVVKDKPIKKMVNLKPKSFAVTFHIKGIESVETILFTVTKYDSNGSSVGKKDYTVTGVDSFIRYFTPGDYTIEGIVTSAPDSFNLIGGKFHFRVGRSSASQQDVIVNFERRIIGGSRTYNPVDVTFSFYVSNRNVSLADYERRLRSSNHDTYRKIFRTISGGQNVILIGCYDLSGNLIKEGYSEFSNDVLLRSIPAGTYIFCFFLTRIIADVEKRSERKKLDEIKLTVIYNYQNLFTIDLESGLNKLIKKNSQSSDDNNDKDKRSEKHSKEALSQLMKYASLPLFSALLSVVSLLLNMGLAPSVVLAGISFISLFDYFRSKMRKISIIMIVIFIALILYVSLSVITTIQKFGFSSFHHPTFIIYILLLVYGTAALNFVLFSKHMKLSRTITFLPAALIPVALSVLFSIRLL